MEQRTNSSDMTRQYERIRCAVLGENNVDVAVDRCRGDAPIGEHNHRCHWCAERGDLPESICAVGWPQPDHPVDRGGSDGAVR